MSVCDFFFVAESAAILKTGRHLAFAQSSFAELSCNRYKHSNLIKRNHTYYYVLFNQFFISGSNLYREALVFLPA